MPLLRLQACIRPGCAIKAAIAAGELMLSRWNSYQKLKKEAIGRDEMLRRRTNGPKLSRNSRSKEKGDLVIGSAIKS
jgi:hypothetical protein